MSRIEKVVKGQIKPVGYSEEYAIAAWKGINGDDAQAEKAARLAAKIGYKKAWAIDQEIEKLIEGEGK